MKNLLAVLAVAFLAVFAQINVTCADEVKYGMLHYDKDGFMYPDSMPEFDRNAPQDHSLIKTGTYKVPWSKTGILKLTHKKGNLYSISMEADEPKFATSFDGDCWQYQNLLFCPVEVPNSIRENDVTNSFVVAIQETPTKLKMDAPSIVLSFYCGTSGCFNLDYEKIR